MEPALIGKIIMEIMNHQIVGGLPIRSNKGIGTITE